jgi:uncharacterized protein YbjT (DUF2867 family)
MAEKILLTGATGTVGSFLLDQLVSASANIRALVRNEGKAARLRERGVEVVIADLSQPETLPPALDGVARVFLLTAPEERQVELQRNMVEAAKQAGVRHLVKLSAIGAGPLAPTLLSDHYTVEQEIEKSGIPFTHLRPNGFFQNTLMFRQTLREQGVFYGPLGDAKVSYVDARDVAAVAQAVLTSQGHEGKAYEITGPQALSYYDMAEDFSSVLGREVRYIDVPVEMLRPGMLGMGMSEWLTDALLGLFDFYKDGRAAHVSNTVREVTGREAIDFKQFAADYAQAFKSKDERGTRNAE